MSSATLNCKYVCVERGIRFETKKPKPRGCYSCGSRYIEWANVKKVINYLVDREELPEHRRIS